MNKHRINTRVFGTPWFLRLAVYILVAIVGVAGVAMGLIEPGRVDGWLASSGSLAAMLGGLIAALHTSPASDNAEQTVIVPQPRVDVQAVQAQIEEHLRNLNIGVLPVYQGESSNDAHA